MEHIISCEAYVRLSSAIMRLPAGDTPWSASIRLDGGCAVATNMCYMIVEKIDQGGAEPVHLSLDPALIAQAAQEMTFSSKMHVLGNEMLQFASVKTSLGYQHPGNAGYYNSSDNRIARWRDVIPAALPKKPKGCMSLELGPISTLAECAPSKRIVFPEVIDWTVPVVIRDAVDPNWCAVFYVREAENPVPPATIPAWVR